MKLPPKILALLLILMIVPLLVHAQAKFENPLGPIETVSALVRRIIQYMLGLTALLALAALIWGGILYIISVGNEQYIGQAKKIIMWAVIGLVVILLSYVIVAFVGTLLGAPPPPV